MKFFKRLLLIILLAILLVGSIIFFNGYKLYKTTLDSKSLTDKISEIKNNNSYVSYDKVPDYYLNAIIAVENFNIETPKTKENLYFITEDNVISRKIAEILVAIDLEKNYSKDQILEFYINTIYFGEGYYGIKQASNGYYDKDPIDLTLNEATILAGVPNAPSVYAPTVNPDLAKNRQGKVIRSMVEYNYLSQDEADKIVK